MFGITIKVYQRPINIFRSESKGHGRSGRNLLFHLGAEYVRDRDIAGKEGRQGI